MKKRQGDIIKIKKKMKQMPQDIIILHMCTKNYGQMMYGSWDMGHDGQMDGWTDIQMAGSNI